MRPLKSGKAADACFLSQGAPCLKAYYVVELQTLEGMSSASEGMNKSPESGPREPELDLDLQLLPAWAQRPPAENQYSRFEGDTRERPSRRGDAGPDRRGPRRPPGGGREGQSRDDRPRQGFAPRGPQAERQPDRRGPGRRDDRRAPEPPAIEIQVSLIPDDRGVESLAKQIRLTGRAYPLFDIAFLILKKPDRYNVQYSIIKNADGKAVQPLFLCELDETLWLSEQQATDHVLDKHFATFYQSERTPTDPPKGTYTFVAQCGMSGAILGPPNYHDYQNKLRKLHKERFSRMPFEAFKSRIKIVRDDAVVKKWIDDQSWKTEYICLNVPEATKLGNREEVERHFREVHFPIVVKSIGGHTLNGSAAQGQPLWELQQLVRRTWDDQMRFPLKVVTVLSHQLATHGMQFFKVNKTVTHVSVARPRYLDLEETSVSEGIVRIVDFIRNTPDCSRRKLLEALAPGANLKPQTASQSETSGEAEPPNPEAAAAVADLHWLIYEGHVIEFSNGLIELAKKPFVKPPAQPKPKAAPKAESDKAASPAAEESKDSSSAEKGDSTTEKQSGELPSESGAMSNRSEIPSPMQEESASHEGGGSSPVTESGQAPPAAESAAPEQTETAIAPVSEIESAEPPAEPVSGEESPEPPETVSSAPPPSEEPVHPDTAPESPKES